MAFLEHDLIPEKNYSKFISIKTMCWEFRKIDSFISLSTFCYRFKEEDPIAFWFEIRQFRG